MDAREIQERARQAEEDDRAWRTSAEEDFEFFLGHQWGSEDQASLKSQKRPCLTINKLKPMVNLAIGWYIRNRYTVNVLPKERGDEEVAKVLSYIIRHILHNTDASWKEVRAVSDGLICGRGYRMLTLDYSQDAYGDVGVGWADPLSIIYDPMAVEPNLSDAEFVMRYALMPLKRMQQVYGASAEQVKAVQKPSDTHAFNFIYRNQFDAKRYNQYMVLECWYKDYTRRWQIINQETGEPLADVDSKQLAEATASYYAMQGHRLAIKAFRPARIKVKTICGDHVLASGDSPFSETDYPIVPYFASLVGGEHQGLVTLGKDAQREFNKRRSELLHILITTGHSGWIREENSLVNENQFEDYAATPGLDLVVKRSARRPDLPRQIQPPMPPNDYVNASLMATQDIQATTGLNDDVLGIASNSEASGRAIYLRREQGLMSLADQMENHRYSLIQLGRILVRTIQKHYTREKVFRIIGDDGKSIQTYAINQRLPAVDRLLNDVTLGKYDVAVSEQPDSPTQRMINFTMFTEYIRDMGKFASGPLGLPLLLAGLDLSPIQNKSEIKELLMQYVQLLQGFSPQQGQAGTAAPASGGAAQQPA